MLLFVTAVYQCVVQALYNVQFLQAIVAISCRFSSSEHEAWRSKGHITGCTRLESIMTEVIEYLSQSSLYDEDLDPRMPAVSLDVAHLQAATFCHSLIIWKNVILCNVHTCCLYNEMSFQMQILLNITIIAIAITGIWSYCYYWYLIMIFYVLLVQYACMLVCSLVNNHKLSWWILYTQIVTKK